MATTAVLMVAVPARPASLNPFERTPCPACSATRHNAQSQCVIHRWISDDARTEDIPRSNRTRSLREEARKLWSMDADLRQRLVAQYGAAAPP